MRKGRTTIAICTGYQRFKMQIAFTFLDKGKIIESGSHEELLALKGTYHRMYELQAGEKCGVIKLLKPP